MNSRSVADIIGPWVDADWPSGLVSRIKNAWNKPIADLSNEMLATFLRQQIATDIILDEAKRRLTDGFTDGSELYEGELAKAVGNTINN